MAADHEARTIKPFCRKTPVITPYPPSTLRIEPLRLPPTAYYSVASLFARDSSRRLSSIHGFPVPLLPLPPPPPPSPQPLDFLSLSPPSPSASSLSSPFLLSLSFSLLLVRSFVLSLFLLWRTVSLFLYEVFVHRGLW